MISYQLFVVPRQLTADLPSYLFKRKALMQRMEDRNIEQLEKKRQRLGPSTICGVPSLNVSFPSPPTACISGTLVCGQRNPSLE
jgi:hypothetical protein